MFYIVNNMERLKPIFFLVSLFPLPPPFCFFTLSVIERENLKIHKYGLKIYLEFH